ncbi:MAG TPA: hypothetical protein VI756_09900 [Blastocatellia bacterium]
MPTGLYTETLQEIRKRSGGRRESGAVWGGLPGPLQDEQTASRLYMFHDLCDDAARRGYVELSEQAKFLLYRALASEGLRVVAAIHTHPTRWVGLSATDRRNQITSRVGSWSIVVPRYGRRPWKLTDMGVHLRTDDGWRQIPSVDIQNHFLVVGE